MSLFIASLNSGSNGNCYYVGNEHEAVLVDAGISCRETEKRMLRLGLSMKKVRAIFVSHEHSDHINGIPVLSKKYQLPVYITPPTMRGGSLVIDGQLLNSFNPFETVTIGGLNITPFPKKHDASDPYSFTITSAGVTVGVFTDIGIACENLVNHFSRCHAAFLEANYDDDMLDKGGYPYHLKRRIRGGNGHLSNKQAVELFMAHRPPFMSHLLLSHLSKNNNDPQLVQQLFEACAGGVNITVASRYQETEVYYINGNHLPGIANKNGAVDLHPVQTSLF
ncbi:MBL fold metallo-hydrolase [Mucilaginibacter gotjawali]|uniref:Phosphoribosyl 1,2-cyclic phosphodiesterase n=1 Tax=Mucilaginibacter gotjawali TaxID=1550579 RepID=A0A839SB22_9SPHI|nr:MBL fold metallo-hydrolase [Mucilaginibacter gotjawali]MBB3054552.1 phosphoribosyl 1,2-cyclic phosphodiesterase [Mucilaginibacter gotjawali]